MQGVDSTLYVYQEVLEGCNELVTAEEYTSFGQVRCHSSVMSASLSATVPFSCLVKQPIQGLRCSLMHVSETKITAVSTRAQDIQLPVKQRRLPAGD